jgi:hypothetical protein
MILREIEKVVRDAGVQMSTPAVWSPTIQVLDAIKAFIDSDKSSGSVECTAGNGVGYPGYWDSHILLTRIPLNIKKK